MLTQVAAENFLSPLIEINFTSRQRRKKVSSLKNVRRRPALELNQMENPSNETICPFIKNKSLFLLHRDWLYLIFAPHPSGGGWDRRGSVGAFHRHEKSGEENWQFKKTRLAKGEEKYAWWRSETGRK
jgi:hypothetical protein